MLAGERRQRSEWQLSGKLCRVHKESVVTQVGTQKEGNKKAHVWYYHGTNGHLEVTRYRTPQNVALIFFYHDYYFSIGL